MKKLSAIFLLFALVLPFHAHADAGKLFGVYNNVQGKFDKAFFSMTDKLLIACGDNQKCKDDISQFLKFAYDNKDKRNMKLVVAKCVVTTAAKKGILIKPTRVFSNLSPAGARQTAYSMCTCTLKNFAEEQCTVLQ